MFVVPLHSYFEVEEKPTLFMEYLKGKQGNVHMSNMFLTLLCSQVKSVAIAYPRKDSSGSRTISFVMIPLVNLEGCGLIWTRYATQ